MILLPMLLLLLLPANEGNASSNPQLAVAVKRLASAEPRGLKWTHAHAIDIDGDGARDQVFVAKTPKRVYVGVVLGPPSGSSQYSIAAFRLAGDARSRSCEYFEALEPESLASPPELQEVIGQVPLGYRHSQSAQGLRLGVGECDPYHLFWNHMTNALDWWRL